MKPTMGSIVHYVDENGEAWPALVRATYEHDAALVDLSALTSGPQAYAADRVSRDDARSAGTWHWPESSTGAGRPGRELGIAEIHRTIDELTERRTRLVRQQRALLRERDDLAFERASADLAHTDAEIDAALRAAGKEIG